MKYGLLLIALITLGTFKANAAEPLPAPETLNFKTALLVLFCNEGMSCEKAKPAYEATSVELKYDSPTHAYGYKEMEVTRSGLKYIAQMNINKNHDGNDVNYRLYIAFYTMDLEEQIFIYKGDMIINFTSQASINDFSFSPTTIDRDKGFYIPRFFLKK